MVVVLRVWSPGRNVWTDSGILPRGLLTVTLGLTDRGVNNEGELGRGIAAREIYNVTSVSSFAIYRRCTALETDDLCNAKSDGSVEISSLKRDLLSGMSILIEMDETIDTEVDGLDNVGVGTGVAVRPQSEGEGTVGGDGDGVVVVTDGKDDE
jgi:hypothetical protein